MSSRIDRLKAEGGPLIKQSHDAFAFSIDTVLLASFARVPYGRGVVVDLGSGNAPLALLMSEKTKKSIIAIEIQEASARLARESVVLNHLEERITVIECDFRGAYRDLGENVARLVCFNPPYFPTAEAGAYKKNAHLTDARHETISTLKDYVDESARLLSEGGALACVYRAEYLEKLVRALASGGFGLKRLRFVYPKTTSDHALLVLCEARWHRPADVKVERPLYIQTSEGTYTDEVRKIFGITPKKESEEENNAT